MGNFGNKEGFKQADSLRRKINVLPVSSSNSSLLRFLSPYVAPPRVWQIEELETGVDFGAIDVFMVDLDTLKESKDKIESAWRQKVNGRYTAVIRDGKKEIKNPYLILPFFSRTKARWLSELSAIFHFLSGAVVFARANGGNLDLLLVKQMRRVLRMAPGEIKFVDVSRSRAEEEKLLVFYREMERRIGKGTVFVFWPLTWSFSAGLNFLNNNFKQAGNVILCASAER